MNKVVVVTGAGSGIGRAIANTLASQGYNLILLGRDRSRLEETRVSLNEPSSHQSFSCDIRIPEEIRKALSASKINNFYALIANAGVGGENHSGEQDRWAEIIETNLTGTYNTVQECIPYLKNNPSEFGKIILISSILARLGVPGYTAYCASKAGLLGLTRSLANELAGEKILVNAVLPGWVNTSMAHEGLQAFADAVSISKESAYEKVMEEVPLRKMSEPDEVARMVSFLISEEQNSITGQTLDINNGSLMP
jgi:NAD(P)-dependent dehydrogenase (short-subunit alcohol dehydrogenase family)